MLGKPLDEFQAAFQDLRKKSRELKELVDKRRQIFEKEGPRDKNLPILKQEIIKLRKQCNQDEQKLKLILDKRMKKYAPEEMQSKSDSVAKLSDNIRILGELFEEN